MKSETLIELTVDIVSAHVGHNQVGADEVPGMIQAVYEALAGAGQPSSAPEQKPEPAVSVRSSVKPDAITCLECGGKLKMLKRHLVSEHKIGPTEYRVRWGLPADYPMVAPNYADKRRELAKKIGLGRKPGTKMGGQAVPASSESSNEVAAGANG